MEERYIASVDLGTSRVALCVAKVTGRDVQVIFYKEAPSDGIRYSAVYNPKKASEIVEELVKEASNELGIKITQVATGLPRWSVRQEIATGKVERSDPDASITEEEIENLKAMATEQYPVNDEKKEIIYGAVAQSFSADGYIQALESEIEGMSGESLEGNFKVFIGNKKNVTNVDAVFNRLSIANTKFFTPDATAKVILTREEMENGVALIDFGAGATSVTIYESSIMRHYASIPFGGKSITNDIRLECGISRELAENIKLGFGICMPDKLQSMSEKVIQINNPETGGYSRLTVKYLSEIITARMKEIVDAILYEISESGFADKLRNGLVITGGTAELTNCTNYIKELSGYKIRRGYPRKFFSAEDNAMVFGASATTALGMIYAAQNDSHFNSANNDPTKITGDAWMAQGPEPRREEAEPVSEHVEETVSQEIQEERAQIQFDTGRLFTAEETAPEEPIRQPKKTKTPKTPRKTPILWTKITNAVGSVFDGMYDDATDGE